MGDKLQELFGKVGQNIINYLPNLLAGILLVAVGWLIGWFVKRVIIQLAVLLRLEKFLTGFRWGKAFDKADIRYGFYNYLGNIFFFIIFIIFFNDALNAWKLVIFSKVLEGAIFYLPRMVISLIIMLVGWMIASWTSTSIQKSLTREQIPRSALIAKFTKAVILLFFSAMALVELEIAQQIVIIGFATVFITLGLVTVVIFFVGGKEFIRKLEARTKGVKNQL
jgi:Mechanosensitive ion channel, conserved TM helix